MKWDIRLTSKTDEPEALPPSDVTSPDEIDLWRTSYMQARERGTTAADARRNALAVQKDFRRQQQQARSSKALSVLGSVLTTTLPGYLAQAPDAARAELAAGLGMRASASLDEIIGTIGKVFHDPTTPSGLADDEKSASVKASDPRDHLKTLAEARSTKRKIALAQALREVVADEPELARAAMNAGEYGPVRFAEPASRHEGADDVDPRARLNSLAKQKSWDEGLPLKAALEQVVAEHPELAAMAQSTY